MNTDTKPGETRSGLFAFWTLPDGGTAIRAIADTDEARRNNAELAEVRGATVEFRHATLRRGMRRQVEQWHDA